jgi:hypothetical protein
MFRPRDCSAIRRPTLFQTRNSCFCKPPTGRLSQTMRIQTDLDARRFACPFEPVTKAAWWRVCLGETFRYRLSPDKLMRKFGDKIVTKGGAEVFDHATISDISATNTGNDSATHGPCASAGQWYIELVPVDAPTYFDDRSPTAEPARQILGAVSQFEKAVLVSPSSVCS